MRLSQYFLPTTKDVPAGAEIVSHRLMLQTGMVRQAGAGIYSWLPMGFRVLENIKKIVSEEMARAGAIEMLMPTLQQADLWRESGRYDAYGPEMLRITDRQDREMLFGPTNEEMITDIVRAYVKSYKQLPLNVFHQQWKFRDEIRPRFGVMRGREFLMKDGYSFDVDEASARAAYMKMFIAYLNIFDRLGVRAVPMQADTGPIGGDLSHEFLVLADTGESEVFVDSRALDSPAPGSDFDFNNIDELQVEFDKRTAFYAATDEKHQADSFNALDAAHQVTARAIEVGHIFYFGTKYSAPMKAQIQTADGKLGDIYSGSYGIGVSRLVGAIIEASHDEKGIIWPQSVAPFTHIIINMRPGHEGCDAAAEKAYAALGGAAGRVLLDDTDKGAGAKFGQADLIGIPTQIIIGPKSVEKGEVEIKDRKTGERKNIPLEQMLKDVGA